MEKTDSTPEKEDFQAISLNEVLFLVLHGGDDLCPDGKDGTEGIVPESDIRD